MTSRTIQELINHARTHKRIHSKTTNWCNLEEILAVIQEQGSTHLEKNKPDGTFYNQRVQYQGYEFIAATKEPLQYPS